MYLITYAFWLTVLIPNILVIYTDDSRRWRLKRVGDEYYVIDRFNTLALTAYIAWIENSQLVKESRYFMKRVISLFLSQYFAACPSPNSD